jgi:hypothetical protein
VWGVFDQATTMMDADWNPVPPGDVRRLLDEMLATYAD